MRNLHQYPITITEEIDTLSDIRREMVAQGACGDLAPQILNMAIIRAIEANLPTSLPKRDARRTLIKVIRGIRRQRRSIRGQIEAGITNSKLNKRGAELSLTALMPIYEEQIQGLQQALMLVRRSS